ncbi:MAG: (2Fe-2S)-binding protein [Armatimonadota bacterium]|nr:(2Fe-2S)-binding protein [Armatimonadota bacterium]
MSHDDQEKIIQTGGVNPSTEPDEPSAVSRLRLSRRDLLKIGGVAAVAGVAPAAGVLLARSRAEAATPATPGLAGPAAVPVTLTINGKKETLSLEPRVTLLDALRNRLDLTGAKKVCDRGACGACTVIIGGKPVMSCMTLAIAVQGQPIETVEGLAHGETLHPIQEAFIAHDGLMCGFCTPGFLMSVKSLLDHNPNPTLDDVKHACQGNVCRCGTYPRVFEATLAAAHEMRKA